jgi:BirA family transcriptional regulator, biotin operon repressor / biotin---[acetyl-CoA-carboxylase] ligase
VTTTAERDAAVLAALRAAAPSAVSGEALAVALCISRVAVSKRIGVLREAGYRIDAVAGLGYTLREVPDLPLPAEVGALLTTELWGPLHGGGTTGSTNDDCKALARAGAPQGTVVLAAEQTAGRGRLGREWESPRGGVYVSALLRPPLAPAEVAPLSLVAGIGIVRGLAILGVVARLKWPNDVWLGDRKVAGILLEMSAEAEAVEWVVVGFGLNVRRGPDSPEQVAYLGDVPDETTTPRLDVVAAACLDGLAGAYAAFLGGGFAALRGEYESSAVLTGRDVVVSGANGERRAAGRVAGVDESGRLVLDGPDGARSVAAGDVTLRT